MFITFFYNKHIIGHEQRTNEYFEPVHFSYVSDVWSSSTQHIWIHFYNACSIWSEAHKSMLDVGQCSWSPEITNTKMECPFYFLFAVSVFLDFSILFLLALSLFCWYFLANDMEGPPSIHGLCQAHPLDPKSNKRILS